MIQNLSWLQSIDLNPLATLIAAFAGAWFAFLFESRKKVREELTKQRAVANRTLYIISEMYSVIHQYYCEVAKPFKDKSDAWLNMPAISTYSSKLEFDSEGLDFLLNLGESVSYPKIILEERRYKSVLKLIELRNDTLLHKVFPSLATAKIKVGTPQLTEDYIESVIGIDNVHMLKTWTPEIIDQLELNLKSLIVLHDAFREAMKRLQPKKKFLHLTFKEY